MNFLVHFVDMCSYICIYFLQDQKGSFFEIWGGKNKAGIHRNLGDASPLLLFLLFEFNNVQSILVLHGEGGGVSWH